jgi:hypothetical protein
MLRLSSIVMGFRLRVVDDRESFQNVSHMGLVFSELMLGQKDQIYNFFLKKVVGVVDTCC